ncbi:acetyltransferase [Devosia sp. Root685]|uniref:GNAT family N-acetyltransferase n=1 Tax=Devosia sp. Root685 TaxID=1736587 RepID=UPI0006F6D287|nr:GNAT family N-acetyltransferase [Devosia sp. Root685]KRA95013.1 acetyltransferase [Devosia sp. Root685]
MSPHIRQARPEDRAALFSICVRTAHAGADASGLYSDPDYPGLVWSVPYLEFSPEQAFVLDDGGDILGYVVGTPNTEAFERQLDAEWWPMLAEKYAGREAVATLDNNVLDRIRQPKHSNAALSQRYPAHLHINLLPPAQSGGWGRKMIETELDALRKAGAKAMHLGLSLTNDRAYGFYQHLGLSEIGRDDAIWMGITL